MKAISFDTTLPYLLFVGFPLNFHPHLSFFVTVFSLLRKSHLCPKFSFLRQEKLSCAQIFYTRAFILRNTATGSLFDFPLRYVKQNSIGFVNQVPICCRQLKDTISLLSFPDSHLPKPSNLKNVPFSSPSQFFQQKVTLVAYILCLERASEKLFYSDSKVHQSKLAYSSRLCFEFVDLSFTERCK